MKRKAKCVDENIVKKYIERDLNGTGSVKRYRAMWNTLKQLHSVNASRGYSTWIIKVLKDLVESGQLHLGIIVHMKCTWLSFLTQVES